MGKKNKGGHKKQSGNKDRSPLELEIPPSEARREAVELTEGVKVSAPKQASPAKSQSSTSLGQDHKSGDYATPNAGPLALLFCFFGIMGSFILYGIVMEYATSGGRKLHELSMIFITSTLYSITAMIGRYFTNETPTTVPKEKLLILALTSMGSTFTSVRSLRYVIYPIQVLAKSCKPVPVMLMGALMGKKYPLKKYINVCIIVTGVALFMQSPDKSQGGGETQLFGVILLFISLCFDGGTGAYEDKLMGKEHVGPFDLMFNIQFGKALIAALCLIVFGQINFFFETVKATGPILLLLGLTGALGQVFIFVTISKFGALTCAIIGLARKIVTLITSIILYGHSVSYVQAFGLMLAISAMVMNFLDKKGKKKAKTVDVSQEEAEEVEKKGLLAEEDAEDEEEQPNLDLEKGVKENTKKVKKVNI